VFTLIPSHFFDPATARQALAGVADLKEEDVVEHIDLPQYDAVLVFTQSEDSVVVDGTPEIYKLLTRLPDCPEYNKILCSLCDKQLHLAIAQGKSLMLANSFPVQDFTTAEYYIFLSLKSLQLNPEISTICWRTPLDAEDEMSLYRYFKAVVNL
jgi:hypothetical protein